MFTIDRSAARDRVNQTLDAVEERMPTVPRTIFRLNRSLLTLGCRVAARTTDAVTESTEVIGSQAITGMRTVQGQARSAVDRTVTTGTNAVNEVAGQMRAQSERVIDTIETEAQSLADDATAASEGAAAGSYSGWSKTELYERAQELDIEGRSSMSKGDLIAAIVSAE